MDLRSICSVHTPLILRRGTSLIILSEDAITSRGRQEHELAFLAIPISDDVELVAVLRGIIYQCPEEESTGNPEYTFITVVEAELISFRCIPDSDGAHHHTSPVLR